MTPEQFQKWQIDRDRNGPDKRPPRITKDEFVRRYVEESTIVTPTRVGKAFFEDGDYRYTATRCRCDSEMCDGWRMDTGRKIK